MLPTLETNKKVKFFFLFHGYSEANESDKDLS